MNVRAQVAKTVFRSWIRRVPVRILLPGGEQWGAGGADGPVMRIVRPDALFRRMGRDANIGFGEGYLAGDWTTSQLPEVLSAFAEDLIRAVPARLQIARVWVQRMRGYLESNTAAVARRNASAHYDLSNEMFATFLDETMTYSAAMFGLDEPARWQPGAGDDLTTAQLRKIDQVLDDAEVTEGSQVIEIGTGWGALGIRAAQRGATVTSLTLSAEQKRLADKRIAEAGVADRVQVLLQDYREAQGTYDAAVSVEMIEAVGAEYWPDYVATLDRLVRPGGRVALQAITMPHERMLVSRRAYTWINKYIFPGGLIPSVRALERSFERHTALRIAGRRDFGSDYARTLHLWRERFLANWEAVAALGFDETFRRTWEYYLAYSEAGFRAGYLDVSQFRLVRAGG